MSDIDANRSERIEQKCKAFEAAWRDFKDGKRHQLPDPARELPNDSDERVEVLPELLKIDLEFRIEADQTMNGQDYFHRFPELTGRRDLALELIAGQFQLLIHCNRDVSVEKYLRQFPDYVEELRPRLARLQAPARAPQIPGYEIIAEIARGGMGVVYKARHLQLGRTVALKCIRAELSGGANPWQQVLFEHEAKKVASLEHPSIVHLFEYGVVQGQPWFSLELVQGGTLKEQLEKFRLPVNDPRSRKDEHGQSWSRSQMREREKRIARLCQTLAQAVAHAHARGIVHQDLKLDNVLLTPDGAPKITDFGLGKVLTPEDRPDATLRSDENADNPIGGTLSYMATEQSELLLAHDRAPTDAEAGVRVRELQRRIGPAVDVYALGAVLYELLTGRPPFLTRDAVENPLALSPGRSQDLRRRMLDFITRTSPKPPRSFNRNVSLDLEAICLRCLEKKPEMRYASAEILAADLQRFRDDYPVEARPVRYIEKGWRWCRRKPLIAGLLAALVLLSVGAFVWDRVRTNAHVEELTDQYQQTVTAKTLAESAEIIAEKRRGEAERARQDAEKASRENLQRFIRMTIATSEQKLTEGDLFGSLLYAIEALAKDDKDSPHAKIHPLRVAAGVRQAPKLLQIWSHGKAVTSVAFSPDATRIVTAGLDGAARIWDSATGEAVTAQALAHGGPINHAIFSPDGKGLATAGEDNIVRLWDAADGKLLREFKVRQPVFQVAFKPGDGKYVLAVSGDKYAGQFMRQGNSIVTQTPGRMEPGSPIYIPGPPMRIPLGNGRFQTIPGPMQMIPGAMRYVPGTTHTIPGIHQQVRPHGDVHVWDVETGQPVGSPIRQDGWINYAAFNPDGTLVVTSGGSLDTSRSANLWSVTQEKRDRASQRELPHASDVHWAVFSPDGKRVVTASGRVDGMTGEAQIWDVAKEQRLGRAMKHSGPVTQVWFSPDGHLILTASADKTARVWSAATGEPMTPSLSHRDRVIGAWFSPDSRRVLTASWDGTARVWDAATGEPQSTSLPHATRVTAAALGQGGRWILTASRDGQVRLWDLAGDTSRFAVLKHPAVLPPSNVLRSMQFESGNRVIRKKQNQGDVVAAAALFSPDGRFVVSAAGSRVLDMIPGGSQASVTAEIETHHLCVWDSATARLLHPPIPHQLPVTSTTISPDGKLLLTVGKDEDAKRLPTQGTEVARLWETAGGKLLAEQHPASGARVLCAGFDQDSRAYVITTKSAKRLVTQMVPSASTVEVRDLVSNELAAPPLEHDAQVERATLSGDGSKLVTLALKQIAVDKKVSHFEWVAQAWDVKDKGRLTGPPLKHNSLITQIAVSPDGNRVITYTPSLSGAPVVEIGASASDQEDQAQLWHAPTGRMVRLKHAGVVTHAAFSPDGQHLVTASADRTARVWDLEGRAVSPPFEHRARINHAALGRNGLVATASNDHSARVWDMATGEPVSPPLKHNSPVLHVAFSADGYRLVTCDLAGTSRVWDLSPDGRDAKYLKKLAQLLACHHIDPAGGLTVVDHQTLQEAWKELRQRCPDDFAVSPVQALAWQQSQLGARPGPNPARKKTDLESLSPALFSFEGRLTAEDLLDSFPLTQKSYCKVEKADLEAGKVYQIDLTGEFDTYLRIEDSAKKTLIYNDDASPPLNLDSRLLFSPRRKDTYRIVVTSFNERETGAYTLQLREVEKAGAPVVVVGKLAKTSKTNQGKYFKGHSIPCKSGQPYQIEVQSQEFDTVLVLLGPNRKPLADNNDIAPGNSQVSRIDFTPAEDGTLALIVTSVNPGEVGDYTLTVQGYTEKK